MLRATLATAFAAACLAASPASAQDTLKIGAIYLDAQGFYAGVRAGINARADELGRPVEVVETNARGDVSKESSFIDTLAVSGIDALILSAVSVDGSARSIERTHGQGIPVVCYNTCVNEATMEEAVFAYAVGDPFTFGKMIGETAAAYAKENGIDEARIGIVNCEQFEVCVTRREGFVAAMEEAGLPYEIVANQEGTELDKAISTAQQMLSANPDINIMFGESGGASLGAVKAVERTGRAGEVAVFGSDMTTEIAAALQDFSILKGVVDISGKDMGALALDLAIAAIDGKESEKIVQAPIKLYTSTADADAWLETHPDGLP